MKGWDIPGVSCGERDKADDKISESMCLGGRKTNQKKKAEEQPEKRMGSKWTGVF